MSQAASSADAAPASTVAGGIFGSAAQTKGKDDKAKEKRTMLKNIDTIGVKMLDPYGVSIADDVPLKGLWKLVEKGDKWARFFSELAADDSNSKDAMKRVGIGISRFAETLINAIKEFKGQTDLRKMLQPKIVEKLDAEADALLPHLEFINAGKTGFASEKHDSFKAYKEAKRRKLDGASTKPAPTGAQLEAAIKALWDFLELGEKSNLRMAFANLSTGGVFFSAHVMDKTARAWIKYKNPKPTKEHTLAAIKERHSAMAGEEHGEDMEFKRERVLGDLFED